MVRVNLDEDVKPLSEFRANVATCIRQTRKTRRPLVITHHGKSAAVLLGVTEYEGLMQKMEVLEDIRLAESQLGQGKGVEHEVALRKVMAKVAR
jgi:antitoxin YefM